MLRIFICDDNATQLADITTLIDSCIKKNSLDMAITISTQYPSEIIAVLPLQKEIGLYFLDIDLKCEIDAYMLAALIRKQDPRAFIVIVTGDKDSQSLIFKYAVEAMDYIIKDSPDFKERIEACIKNANDRYATKTTISEVEMEIKLAEDTTTSSGYLSKSSIVRLNSSDIYCIESLVLEPILSRIFWRKYLRIRNSNMYLNCKYPNPSKITLVGWGIC